MGALFWLMAGCGPTAAPDVVGRVSLAPGVEVDPSLTLVVAASPLTRAAEDLEVEVLRIPASQVSFPLSFRLRGSGGPAVNRSWFAEAWFTHEDDSNSPGRGDLQGTARFEFECVTRQCADAQVDLVIGR
ncbi:MAG: hypothetical protein QM765_23070 [Myxococcales bacterium]